MKKFIVRKIALGAGATALGYVAGKFLAVDVKINDGKSYHFGKKS